MTSPKRERKKRGTDPAATKAVMVRLPVELKLRLELKARALGVSQGNLQAKALEHWLDKDRPEDLVSRQLHELRLDLRRIENRQKNMLEVLLEGLRVLFSLRGSVPDTEQAEHNAEGKRRYEGAIQRIVKRTAQGAQTLVTHLEAALFLSQDQEGAHRKEPK